VSGAAAARPVSVVARRLDAVATGFDRHSGATFILPAVLIILAFSIFPLLASLYVSLTRLQFVQGGIQFTFVGLDNYAKLLVGIDHDHFLGVGAEDPLLALAVAAAAAAVVAVRFARYLRGRPSPVGAIGRGVVSVAIVLLAWLLADTLTAGGRPGTLVVTLVYVFGGVALQYLLGLALAALAVQQLPGRRFFRVVFLLPMMITPVGVAYLFRMLTDTSKGPLYPIWSAVGLADTSWVTNPWGARIAVMIGDLWQWTPFLFIVLVAALESQPIEPIEAAVVDGASRWQIFRLITFPALLPVSTTIVLIRIIEAFKIVDLPNVLTNGGPGTATESLTLHAYTIWRALDFGGSAAVAYLLLFVVTFFGVSYVNLFRNRAAAAA
jgi:multiple sugar transport system permease protein